MAQLDSNGDGKLSAEELAQFGNGAGMLTNALQVLGASGITVGTYSKH